MPKLFVILGEVRAIGFKAISVVLLGAYFVSIVFTMQVIKELINFNMSSIIGATLTKIYTQELSPVITAIILTGKVASAFTAEISVMKVTKQLDAMYMMNTNPISYLLIPRLLACCITLPLLNILSFITSLSNSILISAILYKIPISIFFESINWLITITDVWKSLIKSLSFAIIISTISCCFGLTANNDTKGVAIATTSSVVTTLMLIFVFNFLLSFMMF